MVDEISGIIEESVFAKFMYYPEIIPSMEVKKTKGNVLINSFTSSDMFNIVCNSKLTNDIVDDKINDVIRSFDYPFCWWIGPSTSPKDLSERLISHNFVYEGKDLGLAAKINEIELRLNENPSLSIEQVLSLERLTDFIFVLCQFFDEEEHAAIKKFYGEVGLLGFDKNAPMQLFVAYLDGKPVSTASYYIHENAAGFFDCITLPKYRRKGIGTAITMHRLAQVKDRGVKWCVLSSNENSQGIYLKLGFKSYCEFSTYLYQ